MPNTTGVFTRAQIYEIRARAERGESAPSIARDFPRVGLETIRRVIRGDTYREIGVGASERPMVSNRLAGETRQAGDPAPPYVSPLAAQEAETREHIRRLNAQLGAPAREEDDPVADFLAARRQGPLAHAHASAPALPDEGESPESILARMQAALSRPHIDADELLRDMLGREGEGAPSP